MTEIEAKVWIAAIKWVTLFLITLTAGAYIYCTVPYLTIKPVIEQRYTMPHNPSN